MNIKEKSEEILLDYMELLGLSNVNVSLDAYCLLRQQAQKELSPPIYNRITPVYTPQENKIKDKEAAPVVNTKAMGNNSAEVISNEDMNTSYYNKVETPAKTEKKVPWTIVEKTDVKQEDTGDEMTEEERREIEILRNIPTP